MEEIGITSALRTEEPTFDDAIAEKQALHQEMQQEEDTFLRYKKLQRHLDFLNTMEDYVVRAVLT
jgi:26S proteasome regulatory subunit T3